MLLELTIVKMEGGTGMNIKEKALEVSGSVLKKMVEKEKQGNSKCCAILHQPKRPTALKRSAK